MTSGEWDLRALKALEEEEQAQFQAISEPEQIQIPPPPSASLKLPTIEEFCGGIVDSAPTSPLLPLPSPLSTPLKLSSICGAASVIGIRSCPSSLSPSLRREGSTQSHHKTHQRRHQYPCKGASATSNDSSIDGASAGGIDLGCNAPTIETTNDMMTMMMFLSSTSPYEEVVPTVDGTPTSFLCTRKGDAASDENCNRETGGGLGVLSTNANSSRHLSKKSRCNRKSSKSDIMDYELEDHIKHCSCSCNHMGYGNSMDYQTSGFGGLPDVTEHSNTRRSITHQDSNTNSESADAASIQKTKKQVTPSPSKRKYCIFSLSIVTTLILFAAASIMVYQFVLLAPSRNSHDQRLKIVHKVLKEIPLIDGHNNLAWNIRKYAHNSLELFDLSQELEQKTIWHRPVWSQTDIPRLKQGLVGAQIWSAYVPCEAQGLDAVQLALEQIDIIHRFAELHPKELSLVTSSQEILTAHHKGRLASLIGIEGGHALGSSLGVLRSMHSLGARYLTLANQCDTSWAGSSSMSMEKGLSSFGKAVIKEMNRLGMMIDLSHSSDTTARDVLEVTRAPVIFSNSAARSICNSSRNVPDDILRAVADNGGLIMIGFDSQHVSCDESSTLHHVIAHIKYIRSIAGIQHIGIGARFDGIETPPVGLEDVSKYPNLFATLLEDTNWSEDDIGMLAGMNFLRVLKSVENVRDYWKRAAIAPVEITEPIKKSQCTYMSS